MLWRLPYNQVSGAPHRQWRSSCEQETETPGVRRAVRGPGTAAAGLAGWAAGLLAAALAAAALAATALLAGCGGPAPAASALPQTAYQRELAYAECMRAHGLPGFPDPQSDGTFNSTKQNAGDFAGPGYLSANRSCAHLEGPGMTSAQFQKNVSQALRFAACMRAHGIANFQASVGTGGRISIGAQGANPDAPQFQAAQRACRKLQP